MDKTQARMIRDAMINKMAHGNSMWYQPSYDEWRAISWLADDMRCKGPARYHGVVVLLENLTRDEYDRVMESDETVYPLNVWNQST